MQNTIDCRAPDRNAGIGVRRVSSKVEQDQYGSGAKFEEKKAQDEAKKDGRGIRMT